LGASTMEDMHLCKVGACYSLGNQGEQYEARNSCKIYGGQSRQKHWQTEQACIHSFNKHLLSIDCGPGIKFGPVD
jgi:hypothetical protein